MGGKDKGGILMKKHNLRKLICPLCLVDMKIIVTNKEHINSVSKVCKKYKYYQYHCEVCDQKFTTTESDTLSLNDF